LKKEPFQTYLFFVDCSFVTSNHDKPMVEKCVFSRPSRTQFTPDWS